MKNLSIAFLAAASLFTVGACKKKGGNDIAEASAKVVEFKDKMCACKDKGCADKVNEDYMKWGQEMAKKAEGKKEDIKPDEATQKKMMEAMTSYADCMGKASTPAAGDTAGSAAPTGEAGSAAPAGEMAGSGSGTAGDPAAAAAGGSTGIPECDEYRAAIEKLASCDKMPEAARKAMKDGFDQAAGAWAALPADAKAQAGAACKAAVDATKQAATASGC